MVRLPTFGRGREEPDDDQPTRGIMPLLIAAAVVVVLVVALLGTAVLIYDPAAQRSKVTEVAVVLAMPPSPAPGETDASPAGFEEDTTIGEAPAISPEAPTIAAPDEAPAIAAPEEPAIAKPMIELPTLATGEPAEPEAAEAAPDSAEPPAATAPAEDSVEQEMAAASAVEEAEDAGPADEAPLSAPASAPAVGPEIALGPVPDPGLVRESPTGPLPVIGEDGRQAWRVYARPFEELYDRPRVAILLGGMGMSQSATNAAIQQLPGEVTLAFAAYAPNLDDWIAQARAAGHEVMLQVPMEPFNYPANDPGPHTLLTSLSPEENIERLEWLLSRFAGYVGVTNFMGSKFTASPDHLRPVLHNLKERGLMVLDSRASRNSVAAELSDEIGVPHAINNRFVDSEASRVAIDGRLSELERIARATGSAVGIGYPFPVTIERLAAWIETLDEKGLVLAPMSAVALLPATE